LTNDWVAQRPNAINADVNHVAILKKSWWIPSHAFPKRRASANDGTLRKRRTLRKEGHLLLDTKNHIRGTRVLPELPIDSGLQA